MKFWTTGTKYLPPKYLTQNGDLRGGKLTFEN